MIEPWKMLPHPHTRTCSTSNVTWMDFDHLAPGVLLVVNTETGILLDSSAKACMLLDPTSEVGMLTDPRTKTGFAATPRVQRLLFC